MFVAGLSMRKIAEKFSTNHKSISKALRDEGYTSDFREKLDEPSIVEQYNNGASGQAIAQKLKVSNGVILRILKLHGVDTSRDVDVDFDEAQRLYVDEHKGCLEIASMLEVSTSTVQKVLKDNGVELRTNSGAQRKNFLNEKFFEKIDSEEKAYWLGFMYSGGYVKSDLRDFGISLSSVDKNHLEKFRSAIGYTGQVRDYEQVTNFGSCQYSRVEPASRETCSHLIAHGCTPRKTHSTEPPIGVPDELVRHFCRGVIDGDGGIYVYPKYVNVELVGDYVLLDWISSMGPIKLANPSPHKSIWRIRSLANQSIPWLEWLYGNCNVFLDRKKERADLAMERFSK